MAEENIEQAAEDTLLAAVMAPDVDEIDKPDLDPPQNIDEEEPEADETEAKDAKDAKEAKAETEEEPADDEVEIPVENGEPIKRKLSEVVADAQAYAAFKGQEAQAIERVQREYVQAAQQEYQQVRQFSLETGALIQASMQLLQEPRPPNAEAMLNPASPQYDPDAYHRQFAGYQNAKGQYDRARQLGGELLQRAQMAQARAEEERDLAAIGQLERKGGWHAEFAKDDPKNPNGVRAKFASEMKAAYGYSWEELDAVLTDPRNLDVARDALAYRAMKASSGDVKAKVEAKAPKLTRTKTEAKSGGANRDSKGQFIADAKSRAMKSHSDDDWAAHFAGLVKAGRI